MNNDWLNKLNALKATMPPQREVRPQGMELPPTMGIQSPGQLQPGDGGNNEWLRALLIGATLAGGLASQGKGTPKAPGGYKVPEKPLMSQALHSLAQGIEKRQQGEQLMKQAEDEQRQKAEQEAWDRTWKKYVEDQKTARDKMKIESSEKIAGLRNAPKEPSALEIEEHEKQMKILDERAKVLQAQQANYYSMIKKRADENDPNFKEAKDLDKVIKDTQKMTTVVGAQIRNNILEALNAVTANGFTDLSPLYQVQAFTTEGMETYQEETLSEVDGEEKVTYRTKPSNDYSNNTTLINQAIRYAEGMGRGREISPQDGQAIINAIQNNDEAGLDYFIGIYGANKVDEFLGGQ